MKCPGCGQELSYQQSGRLYCGWENQFYVLGDEMTDRDPLLQEREKTHGPFAQNSCISQRLKAIIRRTDSVASAYGHPLSDIHREALDMIALKLSRILSGQANFKDHWDDIAGYAKLGAEACE
jgi:hypothetical protein